MNTLHIDSITKSLNGRKILSDIYLSCETGTITGLLGRNGEGKSTLLNIIFGTMKGDTQFIRVNEKVLQSQADRRKRIAYLPQHFFLPGKSRVKDLIRLFCDEENYMFLFELAMIQPLLHEKIGTLSGGERRLMETLMVIHSEADFVLLDEPFHALAPKTAELIKSMIRNQLHSKGFIVSDHQYRHVLELSDTTYLLSGGSLKRVRHPEELQHDNYLPKSI